MDKVLSHELSLGLGTEAHTESRHGSDIPSAFSLTSTLPIPNLKCQIAPPLTRSSTFRFWNSTTTCTLPHLFTAATWCAASPLAHNPYIGSFSTIRLFPAMRSSPIPLVLSCDGVDSSVVPFNRACNPQLRRPVPVLHRRVLVRLRCRLQHLRFTTDRAAVLFRQVNRAPPLTVFCSLLPFLCDFDSQQPRLAISPLQDTRFLISKLNEGLVGIASASPVLEAASSVLEFLPLV